MKILYETDKVRIVDWIDWAREHQIATDTVQLKRFNNDSTFTCDKQNGKALVGISDFYKNSQFYINWANNL